MNMEGKELTTRLNEIKEQLFDASTEVKSAFNTVVKYFDKDISTEIFSRNFRTSDGYNKVYALIKALNSGYTIATTETFKNSKEAADYINLFDSEDLISKKKSLELEIKQYKEWQNFYHQYTGPDKYKQLGYYAQKLAACRNELDEINEKLNSK